MLELRDVVKTYQSANGEKVVALNSVRFALPGRGLVFIVGESGSGKSTLLNLLSGIDLPTSGTILYRGKDISRFSAKEKSAYLGKEIALVFQDFNLLDDFTVAQNIAIACELNDGSFDDSRISNALEKVGLADYGNRKCFTLSGGEKQRVAIARSICRNTKVLLCDEPTGSLDAGNGKAVMKILRDLASERLVIVVSHDLNSAYEFGDRVIQLSSGNVVKDLERFESAKEMKLKDGFLVIPRNAGIGKEEILGCLNEKSVRTITFADSRLEFKETKSNPPEAKPKNGCQIEATHALGFARSASIGRSILRNKKGKFGVCLALNFLALSLAFSSTGIACFDKQRQIADSVFSQSWNYLSFDCGKMQNGRFQLDSFSQEHEDVLAAALRQGLVKVARYSVPLKSLKGEARGNSLFMRSLSGTAQYNPSFFEEAGYYIVAGRSPKEAGEILIGDYVLDSYRYYGSENNAATVSDLLGEGIVEGYTVTGVFSSKDRSWFEGDIDSADYPVRPKRNSPARIRQRYNDLGLKAVGFVSSLDAIGNTHFSLASYGPKDKGALLEAVRIAYSTKNGIGYSFQHSEAEAIDVLLGWLYESKAFWIVLAALFFGISFLLSALFLSSFNKAKRTEFVTLLTMGAKKRDVRRVLVGESLFSIGIPSLGALLACIVGWAVAGHAIAESSALGASASLFGWVSSGIGVLLCALVILGISLLSSFSIVRKPLAVGLREGRHES